MALDVYVMPLWRFKAGDFTSPIEEPLGIKPEIIELSAPPPWRPPWYLRLMGKIGLIEFAEVEVEPTRGERRAQAVQEVEELIENISNAAARDVRWQDEGAVHYNKQFHGVPLLKAFAVWSDHRDELPEFTKPPAGSDYWKHPAWQLAKPEKPCFPTLLAHSLHAGYFLPGEFEGCHKTEPYKIFNQWEAFHDVASAPVVLREVDGLLAVLNELPASATSDNTNHIYLTKVWAEELRGICLLGIEHQLPVIFYG